MYVNKCGMQRERLLNFKLIIPPEDAERGSSFIMEISAVNDYFDNFANPSMGTLRRLHDLKPNKGKKPDRLFANREIYLSKVEYQLPQQLNQKNVSENHHLKASNPHLRLHLNNSLQKRKRDGLKENQDPLLVITRYEQCYKERTEKSGGTIRIQGMCPSKLICKIYDAKTVSISFWKTHAGQDKELRTSHLKKTEKDSIINKLKIGVSVDRILEDARKLKDAELQRVNLIGRDEITYLARKHNIDKRRDSNDKVAVALKVQEWNANQKNFAFFYKQEGEVHEVLKKEDFALGFMNSVMEEKLKRFSNIICMDGTHGTNRKGLDLTIVLIKDDRNAGFPVAFFLTNRVDQGVQEVFLCKVAHIPLIFYSIM
nr:unnamed protein product [Callosobruchus analis]